MFCTIKNKKQQREITVFYKPYYKPLYTVLLSAGSVVFLCTAVQAEYYWIVVIGQETREEEGRLPL